MIRKAAIAGGRDSGWQGNVQGVDVEYRVPKKRVEAVIRIAGTPGAESVSLHLGAQAEQHYGPERPSDLLNGSQEFLPIVDGTGRVRFLSRGAIVVVTVAAEVEAASPRVSTNGASGADVSPARSEHVVVRFDDGNRAQGQIRFVPPPGADRLLDYLNSAGRFFPLLDGDRVHLVNSRRVAWITPFDSESEQS